VSPPRSDTERLWAVRGAVQVERNERDAILASTTALMKQLMDRNRIEPDRMVSCIFTCTDDLDAEFPAVAARELGLSEVPLLCNRELDVPGAMERVIRVLVHYYANDSHAPDHTYLGAAQALRADLHSAQ
jgi:chorismate mutase